MLSNDNRNRIFGASLVFAGIVGLIAPPLPAVRLCPSQLLTKAGIGVSYVAPPAPPACTSRPPGESYHRSCSQAGSACAVVRMATLVLLAPTRIDHPE